MVDLTQEQNEALVRLMLLAKYQDKKLSLAEDADFHRHVNDLTWPSDESIEIFIDESTAKVREAISTPEGKRAFIAAQCAKLGTPESKHLALKYVRALFQADGVETSENEFLHELREALAL